MSASKTPLPVALMTRPGFQVFFSVVSLLLIVVFTISAFIFHPFDGLALDSISYPVQVIDILEGGPSDIAGLKLGDEILAIDGREIIPWGNSPIYRANISAGEQIVFEIRRESQVLEVSIEAGRLWQNASGLFLNIALMVLLLGAWGIGAVLSFFAPEENNVSRMIGFHWQLMGISLAAAVFGRAGYFWGANTVFLVAWAFLISTNIIIHMYFPEPITTSRIRSFLVYGLFLLSLGLAIFAVFADWYLFPQAWSRGVQAYEDFVLVGQTVSDLVFLGFLLSFIIGIFIFIRSHFRYRKTDPDLSRQTRIVIWGMIFGTLPVLIFSLMPVLIFGDVILSPEDGFLFFILIPLAYGYAIYQKRLLQVDFVINRALVLFLLILIVLGIGSFLFLFLTTLLDIPDTSLPIVGGAVALVVAIPMPGIRQRTEEFVNRVMYGGHYDFETVTADLSDRLAQTLERGNLTNLLNTHLAKNMGIERSALYLQGAMTMELQGVGGPDAVPTDDPLCDLLLRGGKPLRIEFLRESIDPSAKTQDLFMWGKVFAPLVFEKRLQGFLILGPRVKGTVYSDQDIEILTTVSRQAALAAANVGLIEKLRGLTQQLVRVDEAQRRQVARELHDAVLQNLFFIKQRLLQSKQQDLTEMLDAAISQIRLTIKNQRTSLLDQGLALALQDLIADMQNRTKGGAPQITWFSDFEEGELRVEEETATAVYRIVQEALANALKHAQAKKVAVKLEKSEHGAVMLMVEDDGVGMDETARNKVGHYGLIGMRERAVMIEGDLHVSSHLNAGTTVMVKFIP